LVDAFDEMLAQSADQPLVCPISLHPFVTGRPYRLGPLRRAFAHIASHREQIWLTRPGDICAHIESLPKGTVPGDF
jgi:allantoinase